MSDKCFFLCDFIPQPEAIELKNASIKNGVIYCKFRRDKLTVIQGRTYDLVNTPYHLLVAAGKDLRSTYISARVQANVIAILISLTVQLPLIIEQEERILSRIALMLDLWRKFCTSLNKGWRNVSDFVKFAPRMFSLRAKCTKNFTTFAEGCDNCEFDSFFVFLFQTGKWIKCDSCTGRSRFFSPYSRKKSEKEEDTTIITTN